MRVLLCGILLLPCAGCLAHRATVRAAGADLSAGRSVVGTQVADGAPAATRDGPLPHEVPVAWVLLGDNGRLNMAHAIVRTPLPWWQRFPADLAVDLWPGTVSVEAAVTLVPRPITARSAADITAEARAYGYAQ